MKLKLEGGGLDKFKGILLDFVNENFAVSNCRECHERGDSELEPIDYRKSYDKAVKELYGGLK